MLSTVSHPAELTLCNVGSHDALSPASLRLGILPAERRCTRSRQEREREIPFTSSVSSRVLQMTDECCWCARHVWTRSDTHERAGFRSEISYDGDVGGREGGGREERETERKVPN